MLNYKDRARLVQIEEFYKEWHVLPTFGEMQKMFTLSKGGVHKLMQRFMANGYVKKKGYRYVPIIMTEDER